MTVTTQEQILSIAKPAHLLKPRVLVVEDELRLRELLTDVLPGMGFEAISARTGEEAIKLMEIDPADILLLDLQLPVMTGMQVFAQVRRHWPSSAVIILTGFGDLHSAQEAIRLDVVDFLTKPFHLHEVETALHRARGRIAEELAREMSQSTEAETPLPRTLADAEREVILAALQRNQGNRTAAAKELGISRRKLHYWLNENV